MRIVVQMRAADMGRRRGEKELNLSPFLHCPLPKAKQGRFFFFSALSLSFSFSAFAASVFEARSSTRACIIRPPAVLIMCKRQVAIS
jgi:hypothetical protein